MQKYYQYPELSDSFNQTIKQTLKLQNKLYSCNVTAQQLKQSYQKVNAHRINKTYISQDKKKNHFKIQFYPRKCSNSLVQQFNMKQDLADSEMIRFPLHDNQRNYDHYVTIFKEYIKNEDEQKKNPVWILVHSWQNQYSLQKWLHGVDLLGIGKRLRAYNINPINNLRDFIGFFNEQWLKCYQDRIQQNEKQHPRFHEIYSIDSNDQRTIGQFQFYNFIRD